MSRAFFLLRRVGCARSVCTLADTDVRESPLGVGDPIPLPYWGGWFYTPYTLGWVGYFPSPPYKGGRVTIPYRVAMRATTRT